MTKQILQERHKVAEQLGTEFMRDLLSYLARNCPSASNRATMDATGIIRNDGFTQGFFHAIAMIENAATSGQPKREHPVAPYSEDQFPPHKENA